MLNRVLTFFGVIVLWTLSVTLPRVKRPIRWMLRGLGLVAIVLSLHMVVFNNREGTLEEHWLNWRFERVTFDRAEGLGQDWVGRRTAFGIEFVHRRGGVRRFVFAGFSPWHVDLEGALRDKGF